MTVTKCALIEFFDANSGDMSRFMHTSVLRCYRLRTLRRQKRVLNILFKKIQFALCAMQRLDRPTVNESLLMQCQCGRNCVTFSIHLGALRHKFASLSNLTCETQDTLQHAATHLFTICKEVNKMNNVYQKRYKIVDGRSSAPTSLHFTSSKSLYRANRA